MSQAYTPFLTEEHTSIKELFATRSFLASHSLIIIQGEMGSGKSTLMQNCYQATASLTPSLLWHRPLVSKQDFIEALYTLCHLPYDSTKDEEFLLEKLAHVEKSQEIIIFIDACELMDYNQMKVIAWLHHHEVFTFVLSIRSSEFEKNFYRDSLLLHPSFVITCHPLTATDVFHFIEFTAKHDNVTSLLHPFSLRLCEAITYYTKGNFRQLSTYVHSLFYHLQEHERLNHLPLHLSSDFLAKIALSLHLITEFDYKTLCCKHLLYTSVQRIGTTMETATIGLACFLIFFNTMQVHATHPLTFEPPKANVIQIVELNDTPRYETLMLKITPPSTKVNAKASLKQ